MTAERLAPFLGVLFLLTLVGLLVHDLGGTDGRPLSPEAPKHEAVQARAQLQSERSRFLLIAQQELDARLETERAEAARQAAERQRAAEAEKRRRAGMERRTVTGTTQPRTGASGDVWHSLAMCETGGKMNNPNTGNGYYGFFQFDLSTWRSVGGTGYPHQHSYETQRSFAQKLQARAGWGRWPHCSRALGLR